eukprot:5022961-Prymnesium_polylepis.2
MQAHAGDVELQRRGCDALSVIGHTAQPFMLVGHQLGRVKAVVVAVVSAMRAHAEDPEVLRCSAMAALRFSLTFLGNGGKDKNNMPFWVQCTRRTSSLIMMELLLDLANSTTISSDPPTC